MTSTGANDKRLLELYSEYRAAAESFNVFHDEFSDPVEHKRLTRNWIAPFNAIMETPADTIIGLSV